MERCGGGDEDCDGDIDEGQPITPSGVVELGDGRGGIDDCDECQHIRNPTVVAREGGGAFAYWANALGTLDEVPNIWGVEVDADLRRVGEPRLLSDTLRVVEFRYVPGLVEETGLQYVIKRETSPRRVPALLRVTPDGAEEVDFPGSFSRCTNPLEIVYLNDVVISACLERGSARFRVYQIGEEPRTVDLGVDGTFWNGTLVRRGDEIMMVSRHNDGFGVFTMQFTRLTDQLEITQRFLPSEATVSERPTLLPTDYGYLYWASRGRGRLDETGAWLGAADLFGVDLGEARLQGETLSSRHAAVRSDAGELRFYFIRPSGDVEGSVGAPLPTTDDADRFSRYLWPEEVSLTQADGAWWAVFNTQGDGEWISDSRRPADRLFLARFGCAER